MYRIKANLSSFSLHHQVNLSSNRKYYIIFRKYHRPQRVKFKMKSICTPFVKHSICHAYRTFIDVCRSKHTKWVEYQFLFFFYYMCFAALHPFPFPVAGEKADRILSLNKENTEKKLQKHGLLSQTLKNYFVYNITN